MNVANSAPKGNAEAARQDARRSTTVTFRIVGGHHRYDAARVSSASTRCR